MTPVTNSDFIWDYHRKISRKVRGSMYSHTQNENGTYNTRCLYCFMTIASAQESEQDLAHIEEHHLCPERILSDLLSRVRTVEAHARLN